MAEGDDEGVIYEIQQPEATTSDAQPDPLGPGDQLAGQIGKEILRDLGEQHTKFIVKPKTPPGGGRQEHLGPDGHPHIHLQGKNKPEVSISSRTLEPLSQADVKDYNRYYKSVIDRLTPDQRAHIAQQADSMFYRGTPEGPARSTQAPKADAPARPSGGAPHYESGTSRGAGGGGGPWGIQRMK